MRVWYCALAGLLTLPISTAAPAETPNVILCMADDQGWGDTGYNGHPVLRTPHLDAMASEGVRFDRFYAAAPVCSPTRGSCLTGRHPSRYRIGNANDGHLPAEEINLAKILRDHGYRTGHFGKWHLGTLTTDRKDSNRGRPGATEHYAPPWDHGFDTCFSTEAKVPTWDPMVDPETGKEYGTYYWTGPGELVTENLEDDDSRIIMDRALPFIHEAAKADQPFFAVIWFHTPHKPIVSGPPFTEGYADHAEYYGCITALDAQMGRLREALKELGVAKNTMLWYTSDNGPENGTPGTTGPYRDRKRSLYEGGVRVPGLLVWPDRIHAPRVVTAPAVTSDYLPTILEALGLPKPADRPLDGISILPQILGALETRPVPVAFHSRKQAALSDNRYKIYSDNAGKTWALYDLMADPGEATNIISREPEIAEKMIAQYEAWRESCVASAKGEDYVE
jgi:arylsulfatase A-like enzyme